MIEGSGPAKKVYQLGGREDSRHGDWFVLSGLPHG